MYDRRDATAGTDRHPPYRHVREIDSDEFGLNHRLVFSLATLSPVRCLLCSSTGPGAPSYPAPIRFPVVGPTVGQRQLILRQLRWSACRVFKADRFDVLESGVPGLEADSVGGLVQSAIAVSDQRDDLCKLTVHDIKSRPGRLRSGI